MNISPVNYSNNYVNKNNSILCPSFQGKIEVSKQPNQQNSEGVREKLSKFISNIFEKKERNEKLPYVIDAAYVRAGVQSRSVMAKCYRYGNATIHCCEPEVLEKVKTNLHQMGIKRIKNSNIKVTRSADFDKSIYISKIVSYYDEDEQKSIVFTPEGDMNYKLTYTYSPAGKIEDFDISDVYMRDSNEWSVA
ncbi:hypothetical protein IJ182_10625 [bacterium]|nr:hypothetical protein [bacterium]